MEEIHRWWGRPDRFLYHNPNAKTGSGLSTPKYFSHLLSEAGNSLQSNGHPWEAMSFLENWVVWNISLESSEDWFKYQATVLLSYPLSWVSVELACLAALSSLSLETYCGLLGYEGCPEPTLNQIGYLYPLTICIDPRIGSLPMLYQPRHSLRLLN